MTEAYRTGREAHGRWLKGEHDGKNPYRDGDAAEDWRDGWVDAATDQAHIVGHGFRPMRQHRLMAGFAPPRRRRAA